MEKTADATRGSAQDKRKAYEDMMAPDENGVRPMDVTCFGIAGAIVAENVALERIGRLEAESAKLRELVRYMYRCYVEGHDWGPYGAPGVEWVEGEMARLGVIEEESTCR